MKQRHALLFVPGGYAFIAIPDRTKAEDREMIYEKLYNSYAEVLLFTMLGDGVDIGTIDPVPLAYRKGVAKAEDYDHVPLWATVDVKPENLATFRETVGRWFVTHKQAISIHRTTNLKMPIQASHTLPVIEFCQDFEEVFIWSDSEEGRQMELDQKSPGSWGEHQWEADGLFFAYISRLREDK